MSEHDTTSHDLEIQALWRAVKGMLAKLDSLTHLAGKAAQDAGIPPPPSSGADGIYRAQVTVAIGARSGSTQGTGSARLLIPISGTLYTKVPHFTVSGITNDAGGSPIAVNTVIWITNIDGVPSVIWEDCSTPIPSAFADQP